LTRPIAWAPLRQGRLPAFLRLLDHDHFEDKYREGVHDQYDDLVRRMNQVKTSSALRPTAPPASDRRDVPYELTDAEADLWLDGWDPRHCRLPT